MAEPVKGSRFRLKNRIEVMSQGPKIEIGEQVKIQFEEVNN